MSEPQEIEVEVVEISEVKQSTRSTSHTSSQPASHGKKYTGAEARRPFGGMPIRPVRIPAYLWPLVVILGLILLLLGIVVVAVLIIPFLIIRAIVRLLLGPSRR